MKGSIYTVLVSLLISIVCVVVYDYYSQQRYVDLQRDNTSVLVNNDQLNINGSLRHIFHSSSPTEFIDAANQGRLATVSISTYDQSAFNQRQRKFNTSNGSGVLISSDGYIVTNFHVINNSTQIKVTTDQGKQYTAKVVGFDEFTDIALLRIQTEGQFPHIIIGNSDSLHVGEWVLAVGNPYNLQSSVTAGIVSAKARDINVLQTQGIESFIQTDAAVNPGNSGGPLINTNGELVGINTAIMSETGNSEGFSFAIPSNLVQKVVFDILEFGNVQRAWMGISVFNITDLANAKDYANTEGVIVDVVEKEGAAASAGLKKKDIIKSLNGNVIISKSQFTEQLALYRPGDKVSVSFLREDKEMKKTVILRNQLNTTDIISIRKDPILKKIGVELRNLDTKEARRMRKKGVYVVSVQKDGILDQTNIDPGYIITSCNNQHVENVDDLIKLLEQKGRIFLEGFYENYPGEYPYIFDL